MEKHDLLHAQAADLATLLLVRPNYAVAEESKELAGNTLYADCILTMEQ